MMIALTAAALSTIESNQMRSSKSLVTTYEKVVDTHVSELMPLFMSDELKYAPHA